MKTEIQTVRREDQSVSAWSGGTTTQLAIWPPDADYKQRNFKWRLSSARVDLEESTFTSLPGIHRLIMILEGQVRLVHEGHREITLNAFEQDSFEGDWKTTSFGKCVDFNLMTTEGCQGCIEPLKGHAERVLFDLPRRGGESYEGFYCLSPKGTEVALREAKPDGTRETFQTKLERGDFILFLQREPFPEVVTLSLKNLSEDRVLGVYASIR